MLYGHKFFIVNFIGLGIKITAVFKCDDLFCIVEKSCAGYHIFIVSVGYDNIVFREKFFFKQLVPQKIPYRSVGQKKI